MFISYDLSTRDVIGCYEYAEYVPAELGCVEVDDEQYHLILSTFGWKVDYDDNLIPPPNEPTTEAALNELKTAKYLEIQLSCSKLILSGAKSNALGDTYTYPTKDTDQANLSASVLSSLLEEHEDWTTPFWCCDKDSKWEYKWHSIPQIQQVGKDVKAMILEAQYKKLGYDRAIELAKTREEVNVITWD